MEIIHDSEINAPIELVGGKGVGLFALKSLESNIKEDGFISCYLQPYIPPFFIVPADMSLTNEYAHILQEAEKIGDLYAVRSSSRLEDNGDNSFDGIFDSFLNIPKSRLIRSIDQVRKSATSQKAKQYAHDIGVELEERMPVIVQEMVTEQTQKGVIYSKFPCPRDLLKIIRDDCYENGHRHIDVFQRERLKDKTHRINLFSPVITSRDYRYRGNEIGCLGLISLRIEDYLKHPVIIEFSIEESNEGNFRANILQARRLTHISDELKFSMPQLQEKGLVASTYDANGTGDFTGPAFVIPHNDLSGGVNTDGLKNFDKNHPEGYVLITPFLQFYYNTHLDHQTPNKKVVIAYTELGEHHDMEISRKKGILYLNAKDTLGHQFWESKEGRKKAPIKTNEIVRVLSNGEMGSIYNLSE